MAAAILYYLYTLAKKSAVAVALTLGTRQSILVGIVMEWRI